MYTFTLTHEGDVIGTSKLERGDPEILSVSGLFTNVGGPTALAEWIKSIGGKTEDNVVFIDLHETFALVDDYGSTIVFAEGSLIAIPGEDEAYLDIQGISPDLYQQYFPRHIAELS